MLCWKTFRRIACTSALCVFLLTYCPVLLHSTAPESFPSLVSALDAISSQYKIHLGVEFDPQDKDTTINLDLSSAAVDSVLSSLISQKPVYVWSLKDGAYDVYPKARPDSILDLQIRSFSITKANADQASGAISEIPEVKRWLSTHNVVRHEFEVGSMEKDSQSRVSLTTANVTLRTILNLLNQELPSPYWRVVRYGDQQEYIMIYL